LLKQSGFLKVLANYLLSTNFLYLVEIYLI